MASEEENTHTGIVTKEKVRVKKPSMFKVLLLNDDYTPMDFVIEVLEKFFHKKRHQATEIMLNVHNKGMGVCGVYTHEVAETKVTAVNEYARQNEYPLQCTTDKAEE